MLYTNADQLINKREDLCMRIAGAEPVIMITEVIPKAQLLPLSPALLSVDGYNVFTNFDPTQPDLGRSRCCGICIYMKNSLLCREVVFSTVSTVPLETDISACLDWRKN